MYHDCKELINKRINKQILIVTPDIRGPINNGGIGTAFTYLAEQFVEYGYSVTILYTLGNHSENQPIAHWINQYRMKNINFIPLIENPYSPRVDAPHYRILSWNVDHWLRANYSDYSIVIFPEWMGLAYYALLAKQQGLAYQGLYFIINVHSPESWAIEGNRNLPDNLDDIDRDYMERESVSRADMVISPSNYMIEWMTHNKWSLPSKTIIIQNVIRHSEKTNRVTTNGSGKIKKIVFFGRLETRKGLKLFADSMDILFPRKIADVEEIVFLGKSISKPGFNSVDYIKNRSLRWGLPINIQTSKNSDEALEFLSDPSMLCIIPSLIENSPYTVLECLQRNIRFCASNTGGIPELINIDSHQNCLFEPIPNALATIIEKNIKNPQNTAVASIEFNETIKIWMKNIAEIMASSNNKNAHKNKLENPLVSICMTHHERPILLERAINSIRKQTYRNIEVVLVDDGSKSDATVQYLDNISAEFSEKGWQIIRQSNRYLGAARNCAADHAHGEYLLFMDDDNIAMPHEIETFVRCSLNSGADILTCVSAPFIGSQPPEQPKTVWLPLGGAVGPGLFRNAFGDANAFWNASVFYKLGGYTEDYGVGHEDWELFANAVLSGYKLDLVPEALFWYNVNANGMLRRGDPWADHARSIRPYLRHNPDGLGIAAAYAVFLQQTRQMGGMQSARKNTSILKKIKFLMSSSMDPINWIKLRALYRQHGIRGSIGRIKRFTADRVK